MIEALRDVHFAFGERRILTGVSLALTEGGIHCVLGPSGCGKSTLLRLLAGLLAPDAGTVLLRPADCAMVFQDIRLLPWLTVAENLALGLRDGARRERRARVDAALEQVRLTGTQSLLPAQLSGGMAQRVGIARALLRRPRVLLMDEPFGAIDAMTRAELQQELMQLVHDGQTACVFVTHDVDEALRIGQRILVLRDGAWVRDLSLDRPGPAGPSTTAGLATTAALSAHAVALRDDILASLQRTESPHRESSHLGVPRPGMPG